MVLGREGLDWRSDTINNGFPEPLPSTHHLGPPYRTVPLDLDIQDLGKGNWTCIPPSFYVICTFKLTPFQSGPQRHRPHPSNITSFSVWGEKKEKKSRNPRGWAERRLESGADPRLVIPSFLSPVALCNYRRGDVASFRGHLFAVLLFPAPHHFLSRTHWTGKGFWRSYSLEDLRRWEERSSCKRLAPDGDHP